MAAGASATATGRRKTRRSTHDAPVTSLPRPLRIGPVVAVLGVAWLYLELNTDRGLPTRHRRRRRGVRFADTRWVALGLVLVYRANRIVNFAQAELGSVAAVLAIQFVLQWHWNYFAAIGTGVVIAGLHGRVDQRHRGPPPAQRAAPHPDGGDHRRGPDPRRPLAADPDWWSGLSAGRFETPFDDLVHHRPGGVQRQLRARAHRRAGRDAVAWLPSCASPTTASPSAPRPRTATEPTCSASRSSGCRRSCGRSPACSRRWP